MLQRQVELAQHTSRAFAVACTQAGVRQSMSAVGSSADNALAEDQGSSPGLCDNRPTPAQETRLYIDTSWTIEAATAVSGGADDDKAWLTAAVALNGRTIVNVREDDDGTLHLITDCGLALVVSGEPEAYTIGEVWRLSGWRPA